MAARIDGRIRTLLAAVALGAAGCRDEEPVRLPVQAVTGKVLKNGKPAVHMKVVLFPTVDPDTNPVRPSAQTELDGTFSLGTYSATDGIPQGEYKVAVVRLSGGQVPVASPATVRIEPGTAELPPIVLK